jgi:hypothetical protein
MHARGLTVASSHGDRRRAPRERSAVYRLRAWQRKRDEAGYVGRHWAREVGGRGATLVEQAITLPPRSADRALSDGVTDVHWQARAWMRVRELQDQGLAPVAPGDPVCWAAGHGGVERELRLQLGS